jgi:RHS repeat-associated protein
MSSDSNSRRPFPAPWLGAAEALLSVRLRRSAPRVQAATNHAFGNVTSPTTSDWGTQSLPVTTATNHLAGATYDTAGSIISWGGLTYTWDALGLLQGVSGTAGSTYVNRTYLYTAGGERISERDGVTGSRTLAIRDLDGRVLRRFTESGTTGTGAVAWLEDYVYASGMLVATVSADPDLGTRSYATDHLGTPRMVSGSCATTLAWHTYYPFGMEVAATANQDLERFKFTGQERDLEGTSAQTDDLDNMHARTFGVALARFLSTDALRVDPRAPQSLNLYAYVHGNPVNF